MTPESNQSIYSRYAAEMLGEIQRLTLKTRRGTGYYKVPSLKGVWYRGPFEHSGSVATLEDWFDPRRLRDDYLPTGFKGYGVKARRSRAIRSGSICHRRIAGRSSPFLRTL